MAEIAPDVAWTRPEWLAEAQQWVDARLVELGLERVGPPEQIHAYPWATVLRVPTPHEPLFVKAMVPRLSHEARAISVLATFRPELVTEVVVADADRGWMLMRDAGVAFRARPDETVADWERILADYARLQLEAAQAVPDLLESGVPDYRLDLLPELLAEVLADDSAVWAGREHGLTDAERRHLRDEALPRLTQLWAELAAVTIPETIQHDDLHGGQVFVRNGQWRIIDWGDACVAHPFASLMVPLRSLVYRQLVAEDGPELDRLRDAYLEPWSSMASRSDLLAAVDLAQSVGRATRLLSWQRIVPHFDPPAREEYADSVPRWFRSLAEVVA